MHENMKFPAFNVRKNPTIVSHAWDLGRTLEIRNNVEKLYECNEPRETFIKKERLNSQIHPQCLV